MFVGLPFNYRKSVLCEIEQKPKNALINIVCKDTRVEVCTEKLKSSSKFMIRISVVQKIPPESDLFFEVQVLKVTGVPPEDAMRKDDVVER